MDYSCSSCGTNDCKLWKRSKITREHSDRRPYMGTKPLKCCICAAREEGKDISDIDDNGKIASMMGRTDQIGWYIPAIPCEDGESCWGYTSVPEEQGRWWRSLDTLPKGG